MDQQLFQTVCDEIIGQQQGLNGIGTLGEKTIHSVLKNYYSPDIACQEVKVTTFVADIFDENGIIEIQTRNFDKLRKKLAAFLPIAPVTIVYPIHNIKWIRWINPQTGEVSPPRKSPKAGSPYSIFTELYKIKSFLHSPGISFRIVLMDLEEYRLLDGWSMDKKKGATHCDKIPLHLINELILKEPSDYALFLPDDLPDLFTSGEYAKATRSSIKLAQTSLHILHYIGLLNRVGKRGHSYLYQRSNK